MNLWFSRLFLVAGLFLSISALTPEECEPLVKPLSLVDPSMMYGRLNFIMGYSDSEEYKAILKSLHSSWMNISASPHSTKEVVMYEENDINGTCFGSTFNTSIDGDTATSSMGNITTEFHLLPSCDGCVVFSGISTARNLEKFLDLVKLDSTNTREQFTTNAVYLMGRESTLTDADLEHFKQQASCLGFSGEPDFHYDTKNGFCKEGKGVKLSLT
ncbi:uncharacterized protein LOC121619959 [Chelmon rostratus]|uniref:uncharacterized protein LOC121619156 n=1 Tax=Chelmon rostratus TaxID=109905 RepID=UPI001BEAB733|nr:uncharacterized protein LOC121619156 [Chelmon rostratus]XP_041811839.1 uncharacterized protein LOC121619959 [Chelmon rostratus]